MRDKNLTRRVTLISAITALALIISWLERPLMAALPLPLPGFRLGLANVATLFMLYKMRTSDAAAVLAARIALAALLFGTPVSFALSASGGVLAFAAAYLARHSSALSPCGAGIAASASHMLGQIAAASVILSTPGLIFSYLPYLLLLSVPTGLLTGALAAILIKRVKL